MHAAWLWSNQIKSRFVYCPTRRFIVWIIQVVVCSRWWCIYLSAWRSEIKYKFKGRIMHASQPTIDNAAMVLSRLSHRSISESSVFDRCFWSFEWNVKVIHNVEALLLTVEQIIYSKLQLKKKQLHMKSNFQLGFIVNQLRQKLKCKTTM